MIMEYKKLHGYFGAWLIPRHFVLSVLFPQIIKWHKCSPKVILQCASRPILHSKISYSTISLKEVHLILWRRLQFWDHGRSSPVNDIYLQPSAYFIIYLFTWILYSIVNLAASIFTTTMKNNTIFNDSCNADTFNNFVVTACHRPNKIYIYVDSRYNICIDIQLDYAFISHLSLDTGFYFRSRFACFTNK